MNNLDIPINKKGIEFDLATQKHKMKGSCWISDKHKLILFAIPKNASVSVKNHLYYTIGTYPTLQDGYFEEVEKRPEIADYFKFTIIRDPIQRFPSSVLQAIHNSRYDDHNEVNECKYFKDKVMKVCEKITDFVFDEHLYPQTFFLTDQKEKIIELDKILVLERLEEEFKIITNRFNIKPSLRYINVSDPDLKELIHRYIMEDEELHNFIYSFYREDFNYYNSC
jgi:hypothetical protein